MNGTTEWTTLNLLGALVCIKTQQVNSLLTCYRNLWNQTGTFLSGLLSGITCKCRLNTLPWKVQLPKETASFERVLLVVLGRR